MRRQDQGSWLSRAGWPGRGRSGLVSVGLVAVGLVASRTADYARCVDISAGSYKIGPQSGQLLVKTFRTGLGAKAGHDLTLEATRWHGDVTVDPQNPSASSVTVEAEADSLEVREGTGGVKPLTDSDRAEIKKTMQQILRTGQHQMITFRSASVGGSPEAFHVNGDVTICGATQPVTVQGRIADGRAQGSATVVQSKCGIKPYSAFLGALKLRDEVQVQFDIALA